MGRINRGLPTIVGVAMASAAVAQTVETPAPAPSDPARFNCVVHLTTGGGTYYAGRRLDADGRFVAETAQWVEGHPGETGRHLMVTVQWPADQGRLRFGQGYANFYFDTDRGWSHPVKLMFEAPPQPPLIADAGPGYLRPMAVTAYVRLDALMAAAGPAPAIGWTISGPTEQGRRGPPIVGRYAMAALREAEAIMPQLIARFDAMQANYRRLCAPLR